MFRFTALFARHASRHPALVSGKGIASCLAICAATSFPVHGHSQVTLSSFEDTSNTQQDVFYRGINQHIYFRYYNSAQGWQVQDVTTLSGSPLAAPLTAVSSFKDVAQNQQHVVFEGANGHIYQAYSNSNPTSWSFQDVTSITSGNTAAAATPLYSYCDGVNDIQYIFYIGSNGDINVLYWHGTWAKVDASSLANSVPAAAGSALVGFVENQTPTAHIFYQGADQHIHELYAAANAAAIGTTDNTAQSGAAVAAVGSALTGYFDTAKQQENVFFLGTNQHIQHLTYRAASPGWQVEDVTALGGGATAVAGSALSSFNDVNGNQQHVFYIGSDQHLRQFYYSGNWYPDDLTSDVGSVIPALNSPLTSFKDDPDNQQHAFYIGLDGAFYHFYFNSRWNVQILTGATSPAL